MTYYHFIEHNNCNNCSICRQKVRKFFGKKYTTTCGHKFHLKCMQQWLYYENRGTCPLCRNKEQWKNPDIFLRISGY